MKRQEICTLTNMCMVYRGDQVLVQNRVDPGWSGICFPGGHVEMGESFTDAVIREVYEETGLTISHPQLCGIKNWRAEDGSRYIVLFYKTDRFEGNLTSSEEGEVFFTSFQSLNDLPLAHGMDKMLQVFLDENISEHFFYQENGQWKEILK